MIPPGWSMPVCEMDVGVGGDMGEGALITMELTEHAGVTTMTTVMDFGTKEARDAALATGAGLPAPSVSRGEGSG